MLTLAETERTSDTLLFRNPLSSGGPNFEEHESSKGYPMPFFDTVKQTIFEIFFLKHQRLPPLMFFIVTGGADSGNSWLVSTNQRLSKHLKTLPIIVLNLTGYIDLGRSQLCYWKDI